MIARTWRGWTRAEDADAYVGYLLETGLRAYRETPGNRGAHLLRRDDGDRVEFVTLSFWDSLEAVKRFAGEEVGRAVRGGGQQQEDTGHGAYDDCCDEPRGA